MLSRSCLIPRKPIWNGPLISALWGFLPVLSPLAVAAHVAAPGGAGRHTGPAQPLFPTLTIPRQTAVKPGPAATNRLLKVAPASDFGFLQRQVARLTPSNPPPAKPTATATSPATPPTPRGIAANVSSSSPDVVLDNTLGQFQPISGPDYTLTPSQGALKSSNLFFSFSQFDLASGETASFTGPSSVQNVFGRVTGGRPSSIDGTILCTIPNASLYLVNPAGVVFGTGAALSLKGSFSVTTADQVTLGSVGTFDASHPSVSVLAAAAPTAFGFLSASPAAVSVNGATLAVPAGKSITIAAGDFAMSGGSISAPGGRISIASVGSSGTANFDASNPVSALQTTSFSKLGAITVANGAVVSADGINGPGGRIEVQGDSLTLANSHISAATTGPGQGLGINLNLRDSLTSTNSSVASDTTSSGTGGDLQLSAGSLATYGGTIETNTSSTGPGGQMTVNVAGNALLDGMGNNSAGITALTTDSNAGSLLVRAGATIDASTLGTGNAGTIDVSVARGLSLDGTGATYPESLPGEQTGIGAGSFLAASGSGNAGLASVSAARLSIANGGQIDAGSAGTGNVGELYVNVSGLLTLDGTARAPAVYTSISAENDGFNNTGGTVTVRTGALTLRDANINAQTAGSGPGGQVALSVTGKAILDGMGVFCLPGGTIEDTGFATGIFAGSLGGNSQGQAGGIVVTSGSLIIQNGGLIDTTTFDTGDAGTVNVSSGNLLIRHGGGISSFTEGPGKGGDVTVSVSGGASIVGTPIPPGLIDQRGIVGVATDTVASGAGGQVNVRVGGHLALIASGQISSLSDGKGPAGTVAVQVRGTMTLSRGFSSVQASASKGGDLTLAARGGIDLFNNSAISAGPAQDGGNIHLQSPGAIVVQNSDITAAARQTGGNLTIDSPIAVLQNSQLSANASVGNGGNITIGARQFLKSESKITATGGKSGVAGTIVVSSPDVSLAGSLTPLRTDLAVHDLLLVPLCGQMAGDNVSSFVVIGNGGTAAEPGGLLPAFDPAGDILEPQSK
jgi:filamentous hemagglutinin family protein